MPLLSIEDFISRVETGYGQIRQGSFYWPASTVSGGQRPINQSSYFAPIASLPSGVTAFIPTCLHHFNRNGNSISTIFGVEILLGSINLATNTFTDGAAMPTVTELGVASQVTASSVMVRVKNTTNSSPGTVTMTYTNQDGTTSRSVALDALSSAPVGSMIFQSSMQSTDWGVRDVTNLVQSGGSSPSGEIEVIGLIPLGTLFSGINDVTMGFLDFLCQDFNLIKMDATSKTKITGLALDTGSSAGVTQVFMVGDS